MFKSAVFLLASQDGREMLIFYCNMPPNNDILEKLDVKKLDRDAKIICEIFSHLSLLFEIASSQWW